MSAHPLQRRDFLRALAATGALLTLPGQTRAVHINPRLVALKSFTHDSDNGTASITGRIRRTWTATSGTTSGHCARSSSTAAISA